jgi:hypothetical protein
MRKRLLGLLAGGALLAMGACASSNKSGKAQQPVSEVESQSKLEQQIAERATGAQPGKISELQKDKLVLDPYEAASRQADLALEEKTPVFRGNQEISTNPSEQLTKGSDVLVYYELRPGMEPLVLGIRALTPQEAQDLQQRYGAAAAPPAPEQPASKPPATQRFANADGAQVGTIQQLTQDQMVLSPFEPKAGLATLALPEDVQVLRDGQPVEREALAPGEDVRVFYELRGQEQPKAVGVEILSPEEAEQMKE